MVDRVDLVSKVVVSYVAGIELFSRGFGWKARPCGAVVLVDADDGVVKCSVGWHIGRLCRLASRVVSTSGLIGGLKVCQPQVPGGRKWEFGSQDLEWAELGGGGCMKVMGQLSSGP